MNKRASCILALNLSFKPLSITVLTKLAPATDAESFPIENLALGEHDLRREHNQHRILSIIGYDDRFCDASAREDGARYSNDDSP